MFPAACAYPRARSGTSGGPLLHCPAAEGQRPRGGLAAKRARWRRETTPFRNEFISKGGGTRAVWQPLCLSRAARWPRIPLQTVNVYPDQAQERRQPTAGAGGLPRWARALEPAAAAAGQILCPAVSRRRAPLRCCWPPARVSELDPVLDIAYFRAVRPPRGRDRGALPLRGGQGGDAIQSHSATFSNRAPFPGATAPAPRRRPKPPPGRQIYGSQGASRALAAA